MLIIGTKNIFWCFYDFNVLFWMILCKSFFERKSFNVNNFQNYKQFFTLDHYQDMGKMKIYLLYFSIRIFGTSGFWSLVYLLLLMETPCMYWNLSFFLPLKQKTFFIVKNKYSKMFIPSFINRIKYKIYHIWGNVWLTNILSSLFFASNLYKRHPNVLLC